ncbi:MAG TPA: replicative DNA helicase [Candidatus Paceibacterota bacterium]|nr:replicative DNA helicase [Candidatus Paceibacterota bacterium]
MPTSNKIGEKKYQLTNKVGSNATDRMPPQSIEAEEAVLGAILIDRNAMYKVADILQTDDFYKPAHQIIYRTILDLFSKAEPIDIVSVSNRLKDTDTLKSIGGSSTLSALVNKVSSASNIYYYAQIVHQKKILRDLISASSDIASLGWQEDQDVNVLVDKAEQAIFAISQSSITRDFVPLNTELKSAYERIDELNKQGYGSMRGIATGFKDLDNKLSGLQKSDLIILAARPSLGKTSLALDIARQAAMKSKKPIGFFSLEMSKDQLVDRMLAAQSRIDAWKIRTGHLSAEGELNDFTILRDAMDTLSQCPVYIDDTPSPTILQIRTMARRLQTEVGLGLIVIDYLQLIQPANSAQSMVQQVTEISRGLKAIARELNVPVLALSQLSRDVEKRDGDQKPRLSDLRESGSIEQDADIVMFIYRKDKVRGGGFGITNTDNQPETYNHTPIADIIIAKHRNGPTGQIQLYFNQDIASFTDMDSSAEGFEQYGEDENSIPPEDL